MPSKAKIKLSKTSVLARVNRKLRNDSLMLKSDRSGAFYLIDKNAGRVKEQDVSLGEFAKRIGAIREWEEMVD